MKTLIKIKNGRKSLKYAVEYVDNIENIYSNDIKCYDISDANDNIYLFSIGDNEVLKRDTNIWVPADININSITNIPEIINISNINIYFPNYSVETFEKKYSEYILDIFTYINGDKILLLSKKINRKDALAYSGSKVIFGERYYEYISISIPDPWDITYSDAWADFRQNVCGEPSNINNTGSLLNIELTPVNTVDGIIYKNPSFTGGSVSVNISERDTDFLRAVLDVVVSDQDMPSLELIMLYNMSFDYIEDYIRETYLFGPDEEMSCKVTVTLQDNENIYNYYSSDNISSYYNFNPRISPDNICNIDVTDGSQWFEGLYFKAVFTIYRDGQPFISIPSNIVPFTKNVLSLLSIEEGLPLYIDLDSIKNISINNKDMTDINIVNKIEKKIVNISSNRNSIDGIARPVFFRVYDTLNTLSLHPSVTENIGINLQMFQSNVETFTLKIDNIEIPEYGRVSNNIIFKINKGKITSPSGTYYILDDNKELVTYGEYKSIL